MMKKRFFFGLMLGCSLIISCESEEAIQASEENMSKDGFYKVSKNGITVSAANLAAMFNDAKLTLTAAPNPETDRLGTFGFDVENYTLAVATEDQSDRGCAYSEKGQHIHFIMDNQPYKAFYSNKFEAGFPEGGSNVMLAFLSRSYHESIKTENAYVLKQFSIDDPSKELDYAAPHLFYSRPKGKYIGVENHQKVLLDFYVINVDMEASGYQVKATINGEEFMLPKWQSYFIEGLKLGANTVSLELVDAEGNFVEGPFNKSGEREFQLLE